MKYARGAHNNKFYTMSLHLIDSHKSINGGISGPSGPMSRRILVRSYHELVIDYLVQI